MSLDDKLIKNPFNFEMVDKRIMDMDLTQRAAVKMK
jgi:hypothetical protein